jgi:hypothetical protein
MKADQGRPYTVPTKPPDKMFSNAPQMYEIFLWDNNVEIFQYNGDNLTQRLIIKKQDLNNFETLLLNNGFKQT